MTDVRGEIPDAAAPFWEGLADGEFRLPRCEDCETLAFPPGPICPECGGGELAWEAIDPVGSLHSFTRQHRTAPGFESPITMGIVDLDAGARLLAPIAADYEALSIGQRVRIRSTDYDAAYDRGRREGDPFFEAILEE